jgi:hypothetical protein
MSRILLIAAALICLGLSGAVLAQDAGTQARQLAAALDKTKYKKKDKPNVSIEIYIDIKNEPVAKSSPAEYSGDYASEDSIYRLTISVGPNGEVTGSGRDAISFDRSRSSNFILKDARIDGAVLNAVKVYESGDTRKFAAVFVNRTVSTGRNANEIESRDTRYGLGFIEEGTPVVAAGINENSSWSNRIFLERR